MILRLVLVLAALGAAFVPVPSAWVEVIYSQRAYLALQRLLTPLSNRVSFAVFDLFLAAAAAWGVWALVTTLKRVRKRGGVRALVLLAMRLAGMSALVYLAFLLAWGLNYRRVPLTVRLAYSQERVHAGATARLARATVARANELRREAGERSGPEWARLPSLLARSFERVQRQLANVTPAVGGSPKRTLLTWFFERSGVDGMTDPFFLEILVNSSVLPFERAFVTAHEWAHLAGYADESEANFVGWLVCLQGPPEAEYSGHLALLWRVLPALEGPERQTVVRGLSPAVRADLEAIADRVAKGSPTLRRASWRIYDRYLKANRVEKGIESYDAALELMLGTRFSDAWVPQLRTGVAQTGTAR